MLQEIISEKIPYGPIILHSGLNVVLGDENASNSIGKSTMLLIVDFCFGGKSYANDEDIIKNIGHHTICFSFLFNGHKYFFSRATSSCETVQECDANYEVQRSLTIEDFRDFLGRSYGFETNVSFREMNSTFSRIYGRNNLDEHRPLHMFPGDKPAVIIERLLKLFSRYEAIANQKQLYESQKKQLDILNKAAKAEVVTCVSNKTGYKRIVDEIQAVNDNINILKKQISTNTLDLSVEQLSIISSYKQILAKLQLAKQRTLQEISHIENQGKRLKSDIGKEIEQIKEFFPMINPRTIDEVASFHGTLATVLSLEIKRQKELQEQKLRQITECEKEELRKIQEILVKQNPQDIAVNRILDYQKQLDELLSEKGCYDKKQSLTKEVKTAKSICESLINQELTDIQQHINEIIKNLNDKIYKNKKNSPLLQLSIKNYQYFSNDDTGTGTQYKNMLLLDLALFTLTKLPILIHDSVLFKNVEFEVMDHIIEIYDSFQDKQIFIATDALQNYSKSNQNLLKEKMVISLAKENELYGRSWSNIHN